MPSEARPYSSNDKTDAQGTRITLSGGLAAWLRDHNCSIVFTSYQTGKVCAAGLRPDGSMTLEVMSYARALGLAASDATMWIASLNAIWRLENALGRDELEQDTYDRHYQPRVAYLTGDLDVHELALDASNQPIFVNTKYSCLATVSETEPFRALWKPGFISKLLPEDRCHLNGLAMADGAPAYVTALGKSDVVEGWRVRRASGGILIDVRSGEIVAENLSAPHSPRLHGGRVVLLESGRGYLVSIDPATGAKEDICFCPGFLRGLALHDGFAILTTSQARDGTFQDLPVHEALRAANEEAVCAVHVVDLQKRAVVEKILLRGLITELFAAAVLARVRLPLIDEPERARP